MGELEGILVGSSVVGMGKGTAEGRGVASSVNGGQDLCTVGLRVTGIDGFLVGTDVSCCFVGRRVGLKVGRALTGARVGLVVGGAVVRD